MIPALEASAPLPAQSSSSNASHCRPLPDRPPSPARKWSPPLPDRSPAPPYAAPSPPLCLPSHQELWHLTLLLRGLRTPPQALEHPLLSPLHSRSQSGCCARQYSFGAQCNPLTLHPPRTNPLPSSPPSAATHFPLLAQRTSIPTGDGELPLRSPLRKPQTPSATIYSRHTVCALRSPNPRRHSPVAKPHPTQRAGALRDNSMGRRHSSHPPEFHLLHPRPDSKRCYLAAARKHHFWEI